MASEIRWGVLGPGAIANQFAGAVAALDGHRITAVGSRSTERARAFASRYDVARSFGSYEDLVAAEVDAVYVATPHPSHLAHATLALEGGKAVLCEKPLCVSHAEGRELVDCARRTGSFLMEAMWTRFLPTTREVVRWIDSGAIGEVQQVTCDFGFRAPFDPTSRLYAPELAGGSLLDVGVYCVAYTSMALGLQYDELKATAALAPTGVDSASVVALRFPEGALARLFSAVNTNSAHLALIDGTEGRIEVPYFYRATEATLHRPGDAPQRVAHPFLANGFEYQIEEVGRCIRDGLLESPLMPHEESLQILSTLDEARRDVGVRYPFEAAATSERLPIHRSALSRRLPGTRKRLSRLVLGTMNLTDSDQSTADELLDAAMELGVNAFDTGHVYGGGASERALGRWLEERRLHSEVFLLSKGCHPNASGDRVTPEALEEDLGASLERLRTSTIDLYLLHRDDESQPIEPLLQAFQGHIDSGRIRGYGFSNWSYPRIRAAIENADAQGLVPPVATSPHFSLADQVLDPWGGGCTSLTGEDQAEAREWYARTGLAVFAYSSLARGLFSGELNRARLDEIESLMDEPARRAYAHEVNFARLDRTIEMAEQKGATVAQVALAWVLRQPLNCFPIVGAQSVWELTSAIEATRLELSHDECVWLATGSAPRGPRRPFPWPTPSRVGRFVYWRLRAARDRLRGAGR